MDMLKSDGRLSPITSSSSQHDEESDNYVEYYVHKGGDLTTIQEELVKDYELAVTRKGLFDPESVEYKSAKQNDQKPIGVVCANCVFYKLGESSCRIVSGNIQSNAICKLQVIPDSKIEGGENMSNKGLDVDQSVTTDRAYEANTTSTTEPDPKSELAMQKMLNSVDELVDELVVLQKGVIGVNTYSTTANTTLDAPAPGDTTEPVASVNKDATGDGEITAAASCDCCPDCNSVCGGDCCSSCTQTAKAADSDGDSDGDSAGNDTDADNEVKKAVDESPWAGSFRPGVPAAALRTVFRSE